MEWYETALATHVGRVRQRNEDSAMVMELYGAGDSPESPVLLMAVADGMGGHANGHIASRMALRWLVASLTLGLARAPLEGLQALSPDQVGGLLNEAVAGAAHQIQQAEQRGLVDMGTTLCAALVLGQHALIANLGDSRAYLIDGGVQQLTTDHSLVARLVEQGELTPDEALVHPRRNEIYKMMGLGRSSQPDLLTIPLQAGDILLLCSDGLTNLVSDAELAQAMAAGSIETGLQQLIQLACDRGGHDNITAVALKVPAVQAGDAA